MHIIAIYANAQSANAAAQLPAGFIFRPSGSTVQLKTRWSNEVEWSGLSRIGLRLTCGEYSILEYNIHTEL